MSTQRLYELLDHRQPIYVRNVSGRGTHEPTSLVMLQVRLPDNSIKPVKIPAMRFPINLSSMIAPPEALGNSQDFLDLLNKGILELVEPEDAIDELSDGNVSAAVKSALRDVYNRTPMARTNEATVVDGVRRIPKVEDEDESSVLGKVMQDDDYEPGAIKIAKAKGGASTKVMQMVASLSADASLAKDTLLDLQSMPDDDLGDNDLGYIINNCSAHKSIIRWAQETLAKRSGDDVAPRPTRKRKKNKKHR